MELATLEDVIAFTKDQLDKMIWMMYGVAAFMGCCALINLINTLMTNLLARSRSLAFCSRWHDRTPALDA